MTQPAPRPAGLTWSGPHIPVYWDIGDSGWDQRADPLSGPPACCLLFLKAKTHGWNLPRSSARTVDDAPTQGPQHQTAYGPDPWPRCGPTFLAPPAPSNEAMLAAEGWRRPLRPKVKSIPTLWARGPPWACHLEAHPQKLLPHLADRWQQRPTQPQACLQARPDMAWIPCPLLSLHPLTQARLWL